MLPCVMCGLLNQFELFLQILDGMKCVHHLKAWKQQMQVLDSLSLIEANIWHGVLIIHYKQN